MQTTFLPSDVLSWQCGVVLDSLVLLLILSLVWLAIRRYVSPQWGIALFLLVMIKVAVPFSVSVPKTVSQWTPSSLVEQTVAVKPVEETLVEVGSRPPGGYVGNSRRKHCLMFIQPLPPCTR
jgi:beta-lactamase regulating signal transducer with metallopeptidase domain